MSKENVEGSKWVAQIRKVLGNSKESNLYIISQRLERIDKAFRDLLQGIVFCQSLHKGDKVYLFQYHFYNDMRMSAEKKFEIWLSNPKKRKTYNFRRCFIGNPYFKYYNTYEKISQGQWL